MLDGILAVGAVVLDSVGFIGRQRRLGRRAGDTLDALAMRR